MESYIKPVFYLVDYKDEHDLFLRLQQERQKANAKKPLHPPQMDPIYVSNYLSSTYQRDFHGKETLGTQATRKMTKNLIPPMSNGLQKGQMPVPAKIPKI